MENKHDYFSLMLFVISVFFIFVSHSVAKKSIDLLVVKSRAIFCIFDFIKCGFYIWKITFIRVKIIFDNYIDWIKRYPQIEFLFFF